MQQDETTIIFYGPLPPYRGGISRHSLNVVNALGKYAEIEAVNIKKLYPAWLYPGKSQVESPDQQNWTQKFPSMSTGAIIMRIKSAPREGTRVLLLPWWTLARAPATWIVSRYAKIAGFRVVFICHNVIPHEGRKLARFLSKLVLRGGHAYTVQNDSELEILGHMLGVREALVIPHPVDEMSFTPQESKLPESASLKVLYFGIIRRYKGVNVLIDAISKLEPNSRIEFTLAGEVWDKKSIKGLGNLSKRELIAVRTIFRYVPDDEMMQLFSDAHLVVIPYVSITGSGVLSDAQRFRKPIICSDLPQLSNLMVKGRDGLTFKAGSSDDLARRIEEFEKTRSEFSAPWSGNLMVVTWSEFGKRVLGLLASK